MTREYSKIYNDLKKKDNKGADYTRYIINYVNKHNMSPLDLSIKDIARNIVKEHNLIVTVNALLSTAEKFVRNYYRGNSIIKPFKYTKKITLKSFVINLLILK